MNMFWGYVKKYWCVFFLRNGLQHNLTALVDYQMLGFLAFSIGDKSFDSSFLTKHFAEIVLPLDIFFSCVEHLDHITLAPNVGNEPFSVWTSPLKQFNTFIPCLMPKFVRLFRLNIHR